MKNRDNKQCLLDTPCKVKVNNKRLISQACHNFFVKKPKIFEIVKSERAAANFQESRTPHASTIISKNSQI